VGPHREKLQGHDHRLEGPGRVRRPAADRASNQLARRQCRTGPVIRKGTGGEGGYSGFTVRDPTDGVEQDTELAGLWVTAGLSGSWPSAWLPTTA